MSHGLSPDELHSLETIERIFSCLSLLGTTFISFTFLYSPVFRKPVNRLIFYASWGNTLCNVATLISQSGIRAGRNSSLCQFQGFLIQMFLPADALWNLAMAINVYMTLFRKYNAQQLKALEWRYHVVCYGLPFVVALVYLFVETPEKGKMYGKATLWCWVDIEWVAFRIALCYAPAWACIIVSFGIYIMAGHEIFSKRKMLRAFSNPSRPAIVEVENPFTTFVKTTEVSVTSELAIMQSPNTSNVYLSPQDPESKYFNGKKAPPARTVRSPSYDQYTVTIKSAPLSPRSPYLDAPPASPRGATSTQKRNNRAAMEANAAAWGYTKVALLFFVSLLVTWVPSSINRVYSLIHPSLVSLPFTYASGIVLPSMGFWNSVIYITTSWGAVCMLFTGTLHHHHSSSGVGGAVSLSPKKVPSMVGGYGHGAARPGLKRSRTGSESESVKGLRPVGKGSGFDQV